MVMMDERKQESTPPNFCPHQNDSKESTHTTATSSRSNENDNGTDFRHSMKRMRSSIFFKDDTHGWLKGELVDTDYENGIATVICTSNTHTGTQSNSDEKNNPQSCKQEEIKVKLEQYGSDTAGNSSSSSSCAYTRTADTLIRTGGSHHQPLPLQCLDNEGATIVVEDLRKLPYSNEASILYNLKERYETHQMPYTRATNNVMVAINPYHWIEGLYSQQMRQKYAQKLLKSSTLGSTFTCMMALPPHIYEISSMALKGILMTNNSDGNYNRNHNQDKEIDQTIVVSGESGSGKTVSSKLLMAHLATFHEQQIGHIDEYSTTTDVNHLLHTEGKNNNNNINAAKKNKNNNNNKKSKWYNTVLSKFKKINHNSNNNNNNNLVANKNFNKEEEDEENNNESKYIIQTSTSTEINNYGYVVQTSPSNIGLDDTNIIVQRVIDSNPLLEAFGNAKTFLNDNSSRFSRYSTLQFHVEKSSMMGLNHHHHHHYPPMVANIAGSTCHTFLLEKSRVVTHNSTNNERTFHIFYQIMSASDEDKSRIWNGLIGKDTSAFKYIGVVHGGIDEFTNFNSWKNTITALDTIGVAGEELQMLLSTICIILQLGNIVVMPNPLNEEASSIENMDDLQILADMIGIDSANLVYCLTHKTMKTNKETFHVPLRVEDAKDVIDAFAKECYQCLFDWLVDKINQSTCADRNYNAASRVSRYRRISVLDICGFECFEVNGFEQLLINHTNERLQKMFTETIIDSVYEEYTAEGLPFEKVEHDDNEAVINFLEGKMGLISLLNEECIRPKGSDSGFVNKVYATHNSDEDSSKLFFRRDFQLAKHSKCIFGIRHFAKDVTYDATGFLMKNKDTLPFDVVCQATQSTNDIIRDGLSMHESSTPRKQSALTGTSLWTKFHNEMCALVNQIKETKTWYVRCIIPNTSRKPFSLELKCTLMQLRSVGLLSAMKVSSSSFPNKQSFEYVLHRFWFLGDVGKKKYCFGRVHGGSVEELRLDCERLLEYVLKKSESFELGLTKVYFRVGSLEALERERVESFDKHAVKIQARVRGLLSRRKFKMMCENVMVDQKCSSCLAFRRSDTKISLR